LDGVVRLQSLSIREDEPKQLECADGPASLAIDDTGRYLAAGGESGMIQLWDLFSSKLAARTVRLGFTRVTTLAFDRSGRFLVSVDDGGTVQLSVVSPTDVRSRQLHNSARFSVVAFDPSSSFLAFTAMAVEEKGTSRMMVSTIWLLNLEDADAVPRPVSRSEGWIEFLTFDPTTTALVSKSRDGTVCIWDLAKSDLPSRIFRGHDTFTVARSWSSVASVAKDHSVRLWRSLDLDTEPTVLHGPTAYVNFLAFAPSGRYLAAVDANETACLWDLSEPNIAATKLVSKRGQVSTIKFDASGRYIVSVRGKNVLLWDLHTLEGEPRVLAFNEPVGRFCFHPTASLLVTTDAEAGVRITTVALDELIQLAGLVAGRNLTLVEWQECFGDEPYRRTFEEWPEANGK